MKKLALPIAILLAGSAAVGWLLKMDASAQDAGEPSTKEAKTVGIMSRIPVGDAFPRFNRTSLVNGRAVVVGAAAEGGVTQGTRPQACFSCHGLDGAGDGSGAFPRISGQPAFYLYKQLLDYASGTRPNDIMTPIAKALTPEQMIDVAAYYAAQEGASAFPPPSFNPLALQHGGMLSAVGSAEKGIQACVNCHGPQGHGLPPSFPYLAGQFSAYTELQLQLWKQGQRKNDPLGVMADIASRMTPEDMRNVAAYFAAMSPPGVTASAAAAGRAVMPPASR